MLDKTVVIIMSLGIFVIPSGMTITYVVRSVFNYHVKVNAGGAAKFFPATPGGSYTIAGHVWGPGSVSLDGGNVHFVRSFGVPPSQAELLGKTVHSYTKSVIEHIN